MFSQRLLRSVLFKHHVIPLGQHRFLSSRPLDKVLIANRGEIACRVIRTCKRMGIETVAIYSSADGMDSLHASMADEAYQVGTGPSASESYLRGSEILQIARDAGASFLHPGYGFLSENAKFCQQATDEKITFVGPGPKAIQAMGSKAESKAIMEEANVPTTPGYHGSNQDPDYLLHEAVTNVGFPLLIKAVSGGGGKGMRQVWREQDFLAALESCKRESQSAFGDDSVILEKYLVNPRHVEVQVVADTHGNVLHLYERDCSLQRRHQKIIEEAPASDLDLELRQQLGETGKRAAQAVGYVSAGTVEFLLDTQEEGKFYFCEMNTRLQVEHPVTELITGIDLVEWQLRIAAGEKLPLTQEQVPCMGHAMEARIYAENPARDFLPATGNVWHHGPPAEPNVGISSDGIRVDTGIKPYQDIGVYYDPMISKLIVYGENRKEANDKLISALKQYQIAGVPTNIAFMVKCAQHEVFQEAGAINTGFLEEYAEDVSVDEDSMEPSLQGKALAAFAILLQLENRIGVQELKSARQSASTPWSSFTGSWRMGGREGRRKLNIKLSEKDAALECWSNPDGSFDIGVPSDNDGMEYFNINGILDSNCRMNVVVNGAKRISATAAMNSNIEDGIIGVHLWLEGPGEEYSVALEVENPLLPIAHEGVGAAALHGIVQAPMPGKIVRINATVGDEVKAGDVVIVMEAMKMEHSIHAPRDGTVVEMNHNVGDIVGDRAALAIVDDDGIGEAAV